MFHLSSHSLRRAASSGPARTSIVLAASSAVGLASGKIGSPVKMPAAALAGGAALHILGMRTLGEGAMAGGAALLGCKIGGKWAERDGAPPAAR